MMKHHSFLSLFFVAAVTSLVFGAAPARAWDPFVTPNSNVETGNERMSAGDAAGALAAYDLAARQHPDEPRVALDRGLALLESGDLPAAREAFVSAADPDAEDEIRAAAYYDLGLAFYREGDAAAGEEDHEGSQGFFREAADAFRRSLRVTPGNRDAAWNLELALRRIREQEEAQEEQERQEQEEQDQQEQQDQQDQQDGDEQDQQDGDQQDQQDGDQQDQQDGDEQDQQDGDQQDQQDGDEGDEQDQQGNEGDEGDEQEQGGDENGDPQDQEGEEGQDPQEQNGEQEGEGQDQGGDDESNQHPDQGEQQDQSGQDLPQHVERVLDALQDNEQNLERARARARAAREGRRVLRDW